MKTEDRVKREAIAPFTDYKPLVFAVLRRRYNSGYYYTRLL